MHCGKPKSRRGLPQPKQERPKGAVGTGSSGGNAKPFRALVGVTSSVWVSLLLMLLALALALALDHLLLESACLVGSLGCTNLPGLSRTCAKARDGLKDKAISTPK